jgi:hypothetical protein
MLMIFTRQPGYPVDWGPVAFRHLISQALATVDKVWQYIKFEPMG